MSGYRGSGMFYDLGQFLNTNKEHAPRMAQDLADRVTSAGNTAEASINAASGAGISDDERFRQRNVFQGKFAGEWDANQAKLKADAYRDTAAAEGQIQNMGSFGGLQQLLGQGQQNYTPGMGRLDAFALGASPEARQTMQAAGERFGGLRGMLNKGMERSAPGDWKAPEPKPEVMGAPPTPEGQMTKGYSRLDPHNRMTQGYQAPPPSPPYTGHRGPQAPPPTVAIPGSPVAQQNQPPPPPPVDPNDPNVYIDPVTGRRKRR